MSKHQNLEFSFRQRFGKINWDQLLNLDLDNILSNGDIESLQPIIENLTYSTLDREDLEKFGNSNAVKVFKLSQLAIEYLMYIQNHSQETGNFYISKQQKLYTENSALKETIQSYTSEIESLKSEYFEKRKKIKIQEAIFKQPGVAAKLNKTVTRDNAVPCSHCSKLFTNEENLERHKKRRHTGNESVESSKTDISMMVEMMKTFTEQKILLVSEVNRRGIENLKEMVKLQMQIQNEKESQYFSQVISMLKDQQALMQEEKYKSLILELKFEKEKLSEDFEEEIRITNDTERRLKGMLEEREILMKELEEEQKKLEEVTNGDLQDTEENDRVLEIQKDLRRTPPPQILQIAYEQDREGIINRKNRDLPSPDFEVKLSEPEQSFRKEPERTVKKSLKEVTEENIEIVRTVNIEDGDAYEIPVLKNEVVYPARVLESNAGELESDSESSHAPQVISNCGDILSDSQGSEIDSFIEIRNDRSSVWSKNPEEIKAKDYDSISSISDKSQTIVPKNLNDEEIAKQIGINPRIHKRYWYIVEKFHRAPLPEPWEEHVQEDGVYFITPKGEVSTTNPKIPFFAEYFRSIKDLHYTLSDKILALSAESKFEGFRVTSHYKHDPDFFNEHRETIKNDFLDPSKKIKLDKRLSKKLVNSTMNHLEVSLASFIQAKIFQSASQKTFNSEKEDQKSRDFSEGRNVWPNNQGIKLIQNKAILREKQNVQGGSYFQEGSVLGDSHFERQTGLDESKEYERAIRNRAIFKMQERRKKKYDFESQ